ncbi:MAG: hypothetical protein SWX82_29935 [Cyanobacteriota bacterium]|nr:hypothetical protein [Cyanobacteriota bacterium]
MKNYEEIKYSVSQSREVQLSFCFFISCPDNSDLEKTYHECFNSKSFYFPDLPYSPRGNGETPDAGTR